MLRFLNPLINKVPEKIKITENILYNKYPGKPHPGKKIICLKIIYHQITMQTPTINSKWMRTTTATTIINKKIVMVIMMRMMDHQVVHQAVHQAVHQTVHQASHYKVIHHQVLHHQVVP